ncbi:hypothetical protein ACFLTE_10750 [Bacteroidota bacterium]
MNRSDFIKKCTTCGFLSFIIHPLFGRKFNKRDTIIETNDYACDINCEQVVNIIRYTDKVMEEPVKEQFFTRLGQECFRCTYATKWVDSIDLNGLLEFVNSGKSSRWERLEYNADKSNLKVIGRIAPCDCAFAQIDQPPKSLCNHCCKGFQKEFFRTLLKKKVDVEIDESVILGGVRCSATIIIS